MKKVLGNLKKVSYTPKKIELDLLRRINTLVDGDPGGGE
jgi:hypothetical protein